MPNPEVSKGGAEPSGGAWRGSQLFDEVSFLKTLFDFMPVGILVIDQQRNVRLVNNLLEKLLGVSQEAMLGKHGGEVFDCIYAHRHDSREHDCQASSHCRDCEVKKIAVEALAGNRKQKVKAPLQVSVKGKVQDLDLLLSAAPFDFQGERFAVVIIEDISRLSSLRQPQLDSGFRGIVGRDEKMLELFDTIRKVGQFDFPVLIQGETGTGKELVALAIHQESHRVDRYFVPVNCAALPAGLLESELFGHVKGAFTGAGKDKIGRFQVADGGTIFLDEIGDLHPELQAKMLRVLQAGSFEPVGSNQSIKADVRVISATNKNLEEEVTRGLFRLDLYHRLCVLPVSLPPLRERLDDLPLLADFFLERAADVLNLSRVNFSAGALALLRRHQWPGNIRELQNVVHFALVKSSGRTIQPHHLPLGLQQQKTGSRQRKLNEASVRKALRESANVEQAAQGLGVSRATLYRFLKKHLKD